MDSQGPESFIECLRDSFRNIVRIHPEKVINLFPFLKPELQGECMICHGERDTEPCEHCEEGSYNCNECDGEGWVHCWTCDGDGQEECNDCGGDGEDICDDCDGSGNFPCDECGGDNRVECDGCDEGKTDCDECDGEGQNREGEECANCDGEGTLVCNRGCEEGWVECDDCNEGLIDCDECAGSGTVRCNPCDGDGWTHCGDCGGNGGESCEWCNDGWVECGECEGYWDVAECDSHEEAVFDETMPQQLESFVSVLNDSFSECSDGLKLRAKVYSNGEEFKKANPSPDGYVLYLWSDEQYNKYDDYVKHMILYLSSVFPMSPYPVVGDYSSFTNGLKIYLNQKDFDRFYSTSINVWPMTSLPPPKSPIPVLYFALSKAKPAMMNWDENPLNR